jgi:hypothetical protein
MEFIAESNFMSKFFETRKDRLYAGVTTVGSIAAGAIPFAVLGSSTILLDIGITVTALVGSVLFRPRSDAEIKMLLGKSAMIDEIEKVAATPAVSPAIAAAKTRKEAEKKLVSVMDKVLRVKTALGEDVINAAVPIFENLNVITKKWDALEGYAEVRYTVETMMDDYLPTSIQSYLNIPTKGDVKLAAKLKADLLDQLGILEAETAKIRKNLLADDIQDFNVQGNFLKSRFQQSDTTNMLTMSSNTVTTAPISSPMTVRVPVSSQSDNLTTRISIGPRS